MELRGQPGIRKVGTRGSIPTCEVTCEDCNRVNGWEGQAGADNEVPLERTVSFMRRKGIAEVGRGKGDSGMETVLLREMPLGIICVDQLVKAMERKKTAAGQGEEKKVIRRWRGVGKGEAC